jgi:3D (Asp-Asp-Asp) domain-containing protein
MSKLTRADKHMEDTTKIASSEEAINKSLNALRQETEHRFFYSNTYDPYEEVKRMNEARKLIGLDAEMIPLDHAVEVLAEHMCTDDGWDYQGNKKDFYIQRTIEALKK